MKGGMQANATHATGIRLVGPRLRALSWSGAEAVARQGLSVLFWFVLVIFMTPHDIGVFLLAVALVAIPAVVLDAPLAEALIQREDASEEDWDAAFTANLLLGLAVFLLALLLARPAAWLLREPALAAAVPALGAAALLGALGNIHRAALARELRFRATTLVALAGWLVAGGAALALAAVGFGYWALIANVVIGTLVSGPGYWWVSTQQPRLRLPPDNLRALFPFATQVTALRSVVLVRDQSPFLVLGLVAGPMPVAFFGLAMRVARSVGQLAESCTNEPLLAVMSREQHDPVGAGRLLLELLVLLGTVALPAFIGLAVAGPWIIGAVFGPGWAPSAQMLPWLCVVVAGWLLLHVVAVALRARGAAMAALAVTAAAVTIDLVILAALAGYDVVWALAGIVLRLLLTLPILAWMLRRHLAVPVPRLVARLAAPAVAAALMGWCMHALGGRIETDAARLAMAVPLGGLVYLGALAASAWALQSHPFLVFRRIG